MRKPFHNSGRHLCVCPKGPRTEKIVLRKTRDNGTAPGAVLNREWRGGDTELEAMDYFDIEA